MRVFKTGFNYNQDGVGNRLVFHMQGCNLRCPWCANPEGMRIGAEAEFLSETEVVKKCVEARPVMYAGGGVTFTGGEPTVQFECLKRVLMDLRGFGINTAIETNGTCKNLPELFDFLDYLIMDFKHYDDKKLRSMTGEGNKTIKENLRFAMNCGQNTVVRIPLINGFNASEDDAVGFASELKNYPFSVELLPYHEFGKKKWESIGSEYKVTDGYVSSNTIKKFVEEFKKAKINIITT